MDYFEFPSFTINVVELKYETFGSKQNIDKSEIGL